MITVDDESAPAKAVAAVEKLAGQGVVAITGGYGSNNIAPASDAANKLGLVYMTSGGVDDSLTALRLVQAVFESEHYEVVTASDGMEGLEKVQQRLPDLIVTDSVMPGVDGFAFLRKLKENPVTRMIPVIMLTSGDLSDSKSQGAESQPDVFVTKSAEMQPLLNQARSLLERPQQNR